MNRAVVCLSLLIGLTRAAFGLTVFASAEDWEAACQPDSVYAHWHDLDDFDNQQGWARGEVRGPEGSPLQYRFVWCDGEPAGFTIPEYSIITELQIVLDTGVRQQVDFQQLVEFCDVEMFPLVLFPGTFDGCEEMQSGLGDASRPEGLHLGQNVPNPFNPATRISFQLARAGHVELVVHDLWGRRVLTLLDGELRAGPHQVELAAPQLPGGLYFYTLTTNDQSVTRRMLLLK